MEIEITNVKIFKATQKRALLGYANIILNNSFMIRGIKILETKKHGRFVAMPSRPSRKHKGKFIDLCHPLNQDIRDLITIAILDVYNAQEKKNY